MPQPQPSPQLNLDQLALGLDREFIHRVYRTSGIFAAILALAVWARFGYPAAVGWLLGAAWSLGILASVEWSVQRYVEQKPTSARSLMGATTGKLLAAVAILFVAYTASKQGWLALPWILVGFPFPFIVIALKFLGMRLSARRPPAG